MAEAFNPDKVTLAWTLPWEEEWVTAVTFLGPNRVAAGNNLGRILVWDLPEKPGDKPPNPVRRLDGHTNAITKLVATPDGRWLISASYDHSIRYWDLQAAAKGSDTIILDPQTRARLKRSGKPGADAPGVKVDLQEAARVLEGHREWVQGLCLSADGKTLVSGDDGGVVIVWDREAGKELRRWKTRGWVYALALTPTADRAFTADGFPAYGQRTRGAQVWDVAKGEVAQDLGKLFAKEDLGAAAFSLDGKTLAVGRAGETDTAGGKVSLVDLTAADKKPRDLTPPHMYGVTDIVAHPDGKHFVSSGRDTLVRVWNIADGKMVKEIGKARGGQFKDWIHSIAFSADGRRLAAADMAGMVLVYSLVG